MKYLDTKTYPAQIECNLNLVGIFLQSHDEVLARFTILDTRMITCPLKVKTFFFEI